MSDLKFNQLARSLAGDLGCISELGRNLAHALTGELAHRPAHNLARHLASAHDLAGKLVHDLASAGTLTRRVTLVSAKALVSDIVSELHFAHNLARDLGAAHVSAHARKRTTNLARDLTVELARIFASANEFAKYLDLGNNISQQAQPKDDKRFAESQPPLCAEHLLVWLASAELSECVAGDFEELFKRELALACTKHGVLLANFLANCDYFWRVLRAAPGFLRFRLRRLPLMASIMKVATQHRDLLVRKINPPQ